MVQLNEPNKRTDDTQPSSSTVHDSGQLDLTARAPGQPRPYLQHLPDKSLVRFGDTRCRVDENSALGPTSVNGRGERIVKLKLLPVSDPFPQGAIAELPALGGVSYVKTGDTWLLAPLPVAKPMFMTDRVPWHSEYWLVERKSYIKSRPFNLNTAPLVIRFNVPMAGPAGLFGAEELAFPDAADKTVQEEIRIIIDLPISPEGRLVISTQASAAVTKDDLATKIALGVEKAFSTSDIVPLVFMRGKLRKEVCFEDMFLVELVQKSKGDFQATVAVHVDPMEDIRF
ncbi:hypothetical protein LXA43DRAFT_1007689 [Ganoderma leucocontextum]|nr:hypothetical protein LXA43DRAFT_1007689 [Ganoderma leucocontextum]